MDTRHSCLSLCLENVMWWNLNTKMFFQLSFIIDVEMMYFGCLYLFHAMLCIQPAMLSFLSHLISVFWIPTVVF